MLDNNVYNLIMQITQENKTLWRIKNNYKKEAAGCPECQKFWEKLEKEGEENIAMLEELIKKNLKP